MTRVERREYVARGFGTDPYGHWLAITHNGHRRPGEPCNECGGMMTAEEVDEYQRRGWGRKEPIDHEAARRAYEEATRGE
jgi:hypothetical protein